MASVSEDDSLRPQLSIAPEPVDGDRPVFTRGLRFDDLEKRWRRLVGPQPRERKMQLSMLDGLCL